MKKSDISILICEDDTSLSSAMVEALSRNGYKVTLALHSHQAMNHIKSGYFQCYIIDCMLPGQNGVELAQAIRLLCGSEPHIIMMSGIFKKQEFMDRALQLAQSKYYLTKPFSIETLIQSVHKCLELQENQNESPLQSFIDRNQEVYSLLIENNKIRGEQLPLFLASAHEEKFTGFLQLQSRKNNIHGRIYFHKGLIFNVDSNDTKNPFGSLLVSKGLISEEELSQSLNANDDKRIGERLVEVNSISASVIKVILIEQMKIRISQFIQDIIYTATLVVEGNLPSDLHIGPSNFNLFMDEWIRKRLDSESLKNQFLSLEGYSLSHESLCLIQKEFSHSLISTELKKMPEGAPFLDLLKGVEDPLQFNEVYFMILLRKMNFVSSQLIEKPYDIKISRLKELKDIFESQDHYERLNIDRFATVRDVNDAYLIRTQLLDYKYTSDELPVEICNLSRNLLNLLEESHKILSNADLRATYTSKLSGGGEEESTTSTQSTLDLGYMALMAGDYSKAYNIFKKMPNTQESRDRWKIYALWAEIKCCQQIDNKFIDKVYSEVLKMPIPYDPKRHAHYHVVRGLCHKMRKEYVQAKQCFEHALGIDPSIPGLQKEIRRATAMVKKSNQGGRFTTIISSLLTKKSS